MGRLLPLWAVREDNPLDLVKELRLERHSSGVERVSSLILHVGYTYMKYRASETRWELSQIPQNWPAVP